MTPPTGYVRAEKLTPGVVRTPDRHTNEGVFLPAETAGQGDVIILTEGQATGPDWKVLTAGESSTNEKAAAAEKPLAKTPGKVGS